MLYLTRLTVEFNAPDGYHLRIKQLLLDAEIDSTDDFDPAQIHEEEDISSGGWGHKIFLDGKPDAYAGSDEQRREEEKYRTWQRIFYEALRSYYRKRGLPSYSVVQSYFRGDRDIISAWRDWVEETFGVDGFSLFYETGTIPYFASLTSPKGVEDLLEWDPGIRMDVWFRHEADDPDDSLMIETLFKPLLALLAKHSLSLDDVVTEATYITERGLRTGSFKDLFTELGLYERGT